jgi:hypothetical protein
VSVPMEVQRHSLSKWVRAALSMHNARLLVDAMQLKNKFNALPANECFSDRGD